MAAPHSNATPLDRDERPSKSQKKRDSHALQDLGSALVELTPELLASLDLPEALATAVRDAQRIKAHEGRRRQLQYIGKLMRNIDATPIRQALERLERGHRAETANLHALERWRDALIADDGAIEKLRAAHAFDAERALKLRQLVKRARAEHSAGHPPKSARQLFQELKDVLAPAAPTEASESEEHSDESDD